MNIGTRALPARDCTAAIAVGYGELFKPGNDAIEVGLFPAKSFNHGDDETKIHNKKQNTRFLLTLIRH